MKNGTLRFIPLQSELCLNKQKVDISDFKGWQKCNAAVYGDCLSPLYKKSDTHHDMFIGNDTYDFSEGVLYKNGVSVLSGVGSKKITKTLLNSDFSSVAIDSQNTLVWVRETSSNTFDACYNGTLAGGGTVISNTISNCKKIIATKAVADYENSFYMTVVMYLHTNGKYGYYIQREQNGERWTSTGEGGLVTTWGNFTVVSPLIQVGVMSSTLAIVSFFGKSGTSSGSDVRNVVVNGNVTQDNPTFEDTSLTTDRYQTHDSESWVSVKIYSYALGNSYNGAPPQLANYGVRQNLEIDVRGHGAPVDVELWVTSADEGEKKIEKIHFDPSPSSSQWYKRDLAYTVDAQDNIAWNLEIDGVGTVQELSGSGTGIAEKLEGDITDVQYYKLYSPFINKDNNRVFFAKVFVYDMLYANDPTHAAEYVRPENATEILTFGSDHKGITGEMGSEVGRSLNDPMDFLWDNFEESNFWRVRIASGGWEEDALVFNHTVGNIRLGDTLPIFYTQVLPDKDGGKYYTVLPSYDDCYRSFPEQYKTKFTNNSLAEVNCVMDNGKLYFVGSLWNDPDEPLPTKQLSLAGTYASYNTSTKKVTYTSDATLDISYDADEEQNLYPKYYAGASISIENHYLRIVYLFKAKKTDTTYINILVDSLSQGNGNSTYLFSGVRTGTNDNIQGGVLNTINTEGWRLLFNNNLLSNVGVYENKDYIGTILSDWFTVDGDFCITYNADKLIYRDNQNRLWLLELKTSILTGEYRLVENRYIVLNTTNYFNCYDTQTGLKRHWASDYNNRILYGLAFSSFAYNQTFTNVFKSDRFIGFLITAENANYERTQDTITGLELGAVHYDECLKDEMKFISCGTPYGAIESVDLYRGDDNSTSALYICSFTNGLKFINTDLTNPDAVYPIGEGGDIRYNPNLFTQFISSYNNKDMVISDGIAYKLIYYNNVIPIMAYNLLDGVEELLSAFVLQTSFYGVSSTRLYQMNYTNGVGVDVVADITNMEYLGALPTQALFWSAQNRAIYSFKGNCIMQLSQYANDLTGIYGKWYNPATQELFLDTNIGILVFSDLGTYCLEWANETNAQSVKDIFFFTDYFIINLIGDTTNSHYYSYNNKTGYESNKVHILTKYYGNGLVPITVNNVYIRLYDQAVENAEGFIKMKGYTITDKGTETDTKQVDIGGVDNPTANPPTVAGEAWDTLTGTMLVKYTPQFNRGLGFALEVETTFPIIDIKFDYVENGTIESQIAHVNI